MAHPVGGNHEYKCCGNRDRPRFSAYGIGLMPTRRWRTGKIQKTWSSPFLKDPSLGANHGNKETLPRRAISRKSMMKRVARFNEIERQTRAARSSAGCELIRYTSIRPSSLPGDKNGSIHRVCDIAARLAGQSRSP